jgi:transposase
MFPAEQAQVDWAQVGEVLVGRARRRLSCFVITLAYSRALYLEFFFDQTMENFLRGHVHAFQAWAGSPRVILHDNLRSAVGGRARCEKYENEQPELHPAFPLSRVRDQWSDSATQIGQGDTHIQLGHFRFWLVSAEAGPGSIQQSN